MSCRDKKYNDFRDMPVWQKAFNLLIQIYKIIKLFPTDERFALTDDLKRQQILWFIIWPKVTDDLKPGIKPGFIRFREEAHLNP